MHNHGNQGRKFGRERDQRSALIKGLATSLVIYGHIETTLPKAKSIVPYLEDLITKAKQGDLHGRRMVLSGLSTVAAAHKLVDEIAPKLAARTSGHLRIKQTRLRVGDNTQMAEVSFVDDITTAAPVAEVKPKKVAAKATEKAEK
jgi:large subunit ribosomal protein L17